MKFIGLLLVFLIFEISETKHKFFRTGKKNNLYVVFSKYDISKLSKRKAGLSIVKKNKFVHKGSKKELL